MDCTATRFQLTIANGWRWGSINFLWGWQKFILHFFFVRSIITDCRHEGEASVKATSLLWFEVASKTSHRPARMNQEVSTAKASE